MAGLTAAQVATGVTVGLSADEGFRHPAAAYPLIGAVELYFFGVASPSVGNDLAEHRPYAPTESLGELLAAPVNGHVLSRPGVLLGIGMSALVAAAAVLGDGLENSMPNVFGFETSRPVGYAAAEGAWGALSLEAALGEEMLFRGTIQGAAMRSCGKWCGWAVGSIAFGLAHIPGALLEPDPDFRRYRLRVGVPVVTLLGAYWGAVNIDQKSLTSSVAMHFWHNLLLLTAAFVNNPNGSPLAAHVGFRF